MTCVHDMVRQRVSDDDREDKHGHGAERFENAEEAIRV